jgi:hypothetical protein
MSSNCFDTFMMVHWCSSSRSTPDVYSRLFHSRSRRGLLTNAAEGGLRPESVCRPRRAKIPHLPCNLSRFRTGHFDPPAALLQHTYVSTPYLSGTGGHMRLGTMANRAIWMPDGESTSYALLKRDRNSTRKPDKPSGLRVGGCQAIGFPTATELPRLRTAH